MNLVFLDCFFDFCCPFCEANGPERRILSALDLDPPGKKLFG